MSHEADEPVLIEEKRLIETWITGRPAAGAFFTATIVVFLMSAATLFFWTVPVEVAALMPAVQEKIFQKLEYWRVFTAIFVHADTEHFLSNMYILWIFSYFVFGYCGYKIFPLASFLAAGVVNALAVLTYSPDVELIGASGLVYVLGGFWLTLYLFVQRQYGVMNRLMRVLGIAAVIFLPSSFVVTTSYRTHGIGFMAGILMGLFYFYKNKKAIRNKEVYVSSWV